MRKVKGKTPQTKRRGAIPVRLERLEASLTFGYPGCVPGTSLTRVINWEAAIWLRWSLGLGPAQCPKFFFEGATIEEAVAAAENFDAEWKDKKR